MTSPHPFVTVVGGGLAGCEAALQLASKGISVRLVEKRPVQETPVHRTGDLAEIVCSNSLKSTAITTASGTLKAELDLLGCFLLECARKTAVPAGSALAVDRAEFSAAVTELINNEPLIELVREDINELPIIENHTWLLASGPLTSEPLVQELGKITGQPALHFFDAIAPTVTLESLDQDILFRAARYDRGEADYLNSALDEEQYNTLVSDLVNSEKADVHELDRDELFDGCQPVEEIALSGPKSLAFGPLRPVGLRDPRSGNRPVGIVQLRQENKEGTLYGLVGFQTRLKFGEQKRVFRKIPGLENAEFVRHGQLHRNFYLDTPRCLNKDFSIIGRPDIMAAGQMIGVEGYMESITSGLITARSLIARVTGNILQPMPVETVTGGLLFHFLFDNTSERFSPMNSNFGLVPDLQQKVRGKRERKLAKADRAIISMTQWIQEDHDGRRNT